MVWYLGGSYLSLCFTGESSITIPSTFSVGRRKFVILLGGMTYDTPMFVSYHKPWHTYDCIFTVKLIVKTTAPTLDSMQVPPGLQHMQLARHCVWSPEITGSHSSVSDHEITGIYSISSTWIWLKMQSPQVQRLAIGWHYGTEPG